MCVQRKYMRVSFYLYIFCLLFWRTFTKEKFLTQGEKVFTHRRTNVFFCLMGRVKGAHRV